MHAMTKKHNPNNSSNLTRNFKGTVPDGAKARSTFLDRLYWSHENNEQLSTKIKTNVRLNWPTYYYTEIFVNSSVWNRCSELCLANVSKAEN